MRATHEQLLNIGIISTITNIITARKVAFIRGLAWDVETQADLFLKFQERVLASLTDNEGKLRKLLKKLRVREQEQAKLKAKEQAKKNRALGKGNNISPQLREKKLQEAEKTRKLLAKTKGKGFKVVPTSVKQHQEEMEALRLKRLELQRQVNEAKAKLKEKEKLAEIERKKEEDHKRTEAYKIKLLQEQKARKMEEMWRERQAERLVERYVAQEEPGTLTLTKKVEVPKLAKEKDTILGEMEKLQQQLDELLG